jgi:hypothetical protein
MLHPTMLDDVGNDYVPLIFCNIGSLLFILQNHRRSADILEWCTCDYELQYHRISPNNKHSEKVQFIPRSEYVLHLVDFNCGKRF